MTGAQIFNSLKSESDGQIFNKKKMMDKHGDKGCLDETVEYSRANLTNKQQCHISRVSFTWGNLNYLYLSNVI